MSGEHLHAFDYVLAPTLVWLVWRLLATADLFKAVVLFITVGLLLALAWVRLAAPDIAMAEAGIGAGLTGALLLDARARLEPREDDPEEPTRRGQLPTGRAGRALASGLSALLALAAGLALATAVLSLPDVPTDLRAEVAAALEPSGAAHPVTAVLLNFRAYDTLLEIGVLLLALTGVWSLHLNLMLIRTIEQERPAGPMQAALVKTLVPLMVLVAGHLLWQGSKGPGGAFQAGAVLGGAGVLLVLSRHPLPAWRHPLRFRLLVCLGLLLFLVIAVATIDDGHLLEYRGQQASLLIVTIEVAAAISIGAILTGLFAAEMPHDDHDDRDDREPR